MDIVEIEEKSQMKREAAAARLRELADMLSRHNQVTFSREGLRYSVRVPDEITFKVEVEVGSDGSEIEIELSW
jgi:amphi-Trp domain-containing protein